MAAWADRPSPPMPPVILLFLDAAGTSRSELRRWDQGGRMRLLCCLLCSAYLAVCCCCVCLVALALLFAVIV